MADVVVTVPKTFTYNGVKGLAGWLREGDAPGERWTGDDWHFGTWGMRPDIVPGERVYVVCEGRLVGYALLTELVCAFDGHGPGRVWFTRAGGAVACTVPTPITGFRGWRYRFWDRADERPLDLSAYLPAKAVPRG